ncbi:hemoglobin subunit alpha-D-like [Tubulanus polymorphus]|uniref:hemoglobin subunit alpha-D-like n=1 Tax=Tubulanus polymorphus TaxID=672921 RepID=UPI003DA2276F
MGCEASHSVHADWYAQKNAKFEDVVTDEQIEVIKQTWPQLTNHKVTNGCKIFMHMFANAPVVKTSFSFRDLEGEELFKNTVFRGHGENFMKLLDDVILKIDCLDQAALKRLIPLGHKHGLINAFDPSFLKVYKQSVLYTWENVLGHAYTAHVHEAWTDLLEFVIVNVADGYRAFEIEDAEKRRDGSGIPSREMIEVYTA